MRAIVMLCFLGAALAQEYPWGTPTDDAADNVCLIDKLSCGCCLMRRVMSRMEMQFNMTTLELQNVLQRAQNAIHNHRASRSAFSVALTNIRSCAGPYRQDSTIIYKHVFVNMDDRYNTSTGVFTAPLSGVYNLALTMYGNGGSPGGSLASCVRLTINDVTQALLNENNFQDTEDSSSVSLAARLSVGDRVHVTLIAGCFLCDDSSHRNIFSGFLLYV